MVLQPLLVLWQGRVIPVLFFEKEDFGCLPGEDTHLTWKKVVGTVYRRSGIYELLPFLAHPADQATPHSVCWLPLGGMHILEVIQEAWSEVMTQSKVVESRGVYMYSIGVPQTVFAPLAYMRCLKQPRVSGCGSYHPFLSGSQHSFERNSSSVCILQALSWTEANWDTRAEFWKSSSCVLHLGWQVKSQSIMPF